MNSQAFTDSKTIANLQLKGVLKKTSSFQDSFDVMKTCESYEEYILKADIAGIPKELQYTKDQFTEIKKLYDKYFRFLRN